MANLWRIFPTLGKSYLVTERQMNMENGGFLRFSAFGTPPAKMSASPATGAQKHRFRELDHDLRSQECPQRLFAVTVAFFASAILMAGAVGPAIA
jgi:hypothetical protein